MSELFRKAITAGVVLMLHLPLGWYFIRSGSSSTDLAGAAAQARQAKVAQPVAMPKLGVVEKIGPRRSESIDQLKQEPREIRKVDQHADATEKHVPANPSIRSIATSNPVEPKPKSLSEMNDQEQADVLARYKMEIEQGKTEILLELDKGIRAADLAGEFIIEGLNQTIVFNQWGLRTERTGSLQSDIHLSELPFDYRQVLVRNFGLGGEEHYKASVILSRKVEIEMYRSLYEHLKRSRQDSPRSDWVYCARIGHTSPRFRWTDYGPNHSTSFVGNRKP